MARRPTAFISVVAIAGALALPTTAPASRWHRLAGPSEANGLVVGDGLRTLAYRQRTDLQLLDQTGAATHSVALPSSACDPRQMALGTAWIECRTFDRADGLASYPEGYRAVASRTLSEQGGRPTAIFAFGDQWLQLYYSPPTGTTHAAFVNWHTGEVMPSPNIGAAGGGSLRGESLDGATPSNEMPCFAGQVLDRQADRLLVLRTRANGAGSEVYLADCGDKVTTQKLGTTTAPDHVQGQLSANYASWTSRSTATVVRLPSKHRFIWRFSGTRRVSAPVTLAHARGRLLVSVFRADGKREILTAAIPK